MAFASFVLQGGSMAKHDMKATMNVNRRTWDEEHRIEVVIKLGTGRTIAAELSAEAFMLAITGRSEIEVDLTLRNVDIVITGKDGAEM